MATYREQMKQDILITLGGNLIGVELGEDELDMCLRYALDTYRQRSENSVEESYADMWLKKEQAEYFLPNEIVEVNKIYRRGFGNTAGSSASVVDPFELAYTNMYLLNSTNASGGLLTYELYAQRNELTARMFGRDISFTWNPVSHSITIHRTPRADEKVLLCTYNLRPDESLLQDYAIKPWLRSWSIAEAKGILGQVRGKYQSINAGANGGATLNGSDLLSQSQQEKEKLIEELKLKVDGSKPLSFIIG